MLWRNAIFATRDDESSVELLSDNFERLGSNDTPFTLRGGTEKREKAETIHQKEA